MKRITLFNNQNQQQKTTILMESPTIQQIHDCCKNKLRIKSTRIFHQSNQVTSQSQLDSLLESVSELSLVLSKGEDFIGASIPIQPFKHPTTIKVIATKSFIDQEAIAQLKTTATLEGIVSAVGMPDLHPGNKYPVGAVFASKDIIYPALIGGDIGCGMCLYALENLKSNIDPKSISQRLKGLDSPFTGDFNSILREYNVLGDSNPDGLGTIGGGNHFAEFQIIDRIEDKEIFNSLKLSESHCYLLIHSGSRGLGQSILDDHTLKHNSLGLKSSTLEYNEYMTKHDNACNWARANRELIKSRCLNLIGYESNVRKVLDITHNSVSEKTFNDSNYFLHRKGAAPSDSGLIVIPGSRGDYTYLVQAIGDQIDNLFSVAHGAGRQKSRSRVSQDVRKKHGNTARAIESLKTNKFGGIIVCEDKDLMLEECPAAYKSCEEVIKDLEGIVQVIAVFKPICTYKCG